MPELRHLRAFAAVARERNFTRAAERLHLAQSAVSKTVAQLEAELGVALIERTTHDVRLTAAGEGLFEDVEALLPGIDAAVARARAHGSGLSGAIAIGVTGAVGPGVRRAIAAGLRADAPDLSVALRGLRPGEFGEMLREGRVDAIVARSVGAGAAGLTVEPLAPGPATLMVPDGHRLATAERAGLADLDGERLMVWSPPGTPFTDLLVGMCAAAGATVTPVESAVVGDGGGELLELADLGVVAIVPEGRQPAPGTVALALDGAVLPLVLLRRPGPVPPAVARLIALLG